MPRRTYVFRHFLEFEFSFRVVAAIVGRWFFALGASRLRWGIDNLLAIDDQSEVRAGTGLDGNALGRSLFQIYLRVLPGNYYVQRCEKIFVLLQIQFELGIVRTHQRVHVGLLVQFVIFSVRLNVLPRVGPYVVLKHGVARVPPPWLPVLAHRPDRMALVMKPRSVLKKLIYTFISI